MTTSVTSLSNATIFSPFSQTVTVSAGITTTDQIFFITVTKSPISTGGTGTSLAYQSLTINSQDFKSVDSRTFNYGAGITQATFTFSGTYTDYMFTDQKIKYYDNPTNIGIGVSTTKEYPTLNVNVNTSNPEAFTFLNYQTDATRESTSNTRQQFYYETQSWANVPNPVDAIYSFEPSVQGSVPYFTYTFNVVGTGLTAPFNRTVSITHTVNYSLDYEKAQFLNALNTQRF